MKQNFRFEKFVLAFSFFVCVALLFCTCGLENYYVMDRRPSAGNVREYTNEDPALRYFEFYAAPNSNAGVSEFRFLGTAVYYKIYSNASTMVSNCNSIEAVNTSSNYSAAAERLINTYGFKELNTSTGSVSPLVPEGYEGYYVCIRLTNNNESSGTEASWWSNIARIEIRPSKNAAAVVTYIPRRANNYSFDFGRANNATYSSTGLTYDAPKSGDEDFDGGAVSDNKYYVAMYAVAKGRDTTFTNFYSNVTYLGSMTINASAENN